MQKTFFFLFLVALVSFSCNRHNKMEKKPIQKDGVHFMESNSLQTVLEKAQVENKLVFLDLYTDWCMPCKMMDEDVYPDKKLGDFMNKRFISYKSNAEKGNGVTLATVFNVRYYPTLLFLDAQGHELERKEGAMFYTEIKEMANRVLSTQGM